MWGPPPKYGTLEKKYHECANKPSDIHEHLTVLRSLVTTKTRVVELGVRDGVSTWALLSGRPARQWSIDIKPTPALAEIQRICQEESQPWDFVCNDSLVWGVPPHDLLFIDTLHTYAHCLAELKRYAPHCSTHIALHDTHTYRHRGEDGSAPGLEQAIVDFLETEDGALWHVILWRTNNNGLTVLERVALSRSASPATSPPSSRPRP